jgi:hypothetical protein
MFIKKILPNVLRRPALLVLLSLPLCACTEIIYDVGYEATIHRAPTVDSVKVTFSDGTSILEQETIGPELDSITVKSSKERSGHFMFSVGVFCSGATDWTFVIPYPIYVDEETRIFIRDTGPIDCEHIANRDVIYEISPRSIFNN